MKQIRKKIYSVALLALVLMTCAAIPVRAASRDDIDEAMRESLTNTAKGLAQTIVELDQEEIDAYKESGDEFTVMAMQAWEGSRDELGNFVSLGKPAPGTVTDGYSVKISAEFTKYNADFVCLFDETGTPSSFSIDVQYPMSVLLQRAGMNTLMGLGIVFAMLLFLTFVISMFRLIGAAQDKSQTEKEGPAVPLPAQRSPQIIQQERPRQDDKELVAVIAAAIAAYEGTSTDRFVVRSIRKASRRKARW